MFICLGRFALRNNTDGRTDRQGDSYIPSKTLFAGGIITFQCTKLQTIIKSFIQKNTEKNITFYIYVSQRIMFIVSKCLTKSN